MKPERPLYFPVQPEPLRMQPGLFRFGTDFGNGDADQRFFPRDATLPHYLGEKSRVLAAHPERDGYSIQSAREEASVLAAEHWLKGTLRTEAQVELTDVPRASLGAQLMEDFAVLGKDESGQDRTLWLHACFPSGWRPEHVIGNGFSQIHARIPAFEAVAKKAPSLVDAMLTRGPYVRFVWTISADDALDHHPDEGERAPWSGATEHGFLRVERQTTVPLPGANACVFLIRTFLYDFAVLDPEKREILARALEQMPAEIQRYKSLSGAVPHALRLLR